MSRNSKSNILNVVFFVLSIFSFYSYSDVRANDWLQQQQKKLEHQQQEFIKNKDIFLHDAKKENIDKLDKEEKCFLIKKITLSEFDGTKITPSSAISEKLSHYENRCLGLKNIKSIIEKINNIYINKGFITTRVFVKPQNLSNGNLDVTVIDGILDKITIEDQTLTDRELMMAFPNREEHTLNLRDLEQGLEQLNRLSSNNVKMKLIPGTRQGSTKVSLTNDNSAIWYGNIGLTNDVSERLSRWQLNANLALDSLLGFDDKFLFSASRLVGHYQTHNESNSYAFLGNIPLGYWLFGVKINYFDYEQEISGNIIDFLSHGNAAIQQFYVNRTVYRGQNSKLNLGGSITRKETKNYIEDVYLETSSRKLYFLGLSGDYIHYFPDGANVDLNLLWERSEPWWGATRKVVSEENDFQFDRFTLNVSYYQPLSFWSKNTNLNVTGSYVISDKDIVTSEGASVGGRYDVRGFGDNSLYGYQGGYLTGQIEKNLLERVRYPFKRIKIYSALDVGVIKQNNDFSKSDDKTLVGTSFGITAYANSFNVDIVFSKGLYKPKSFDTDRESLFINFSLAY